MASSDLRPVIDPGEDESAFIRRRADQERQRIAEIFMRSACGHGWAGHGLRRLACDPSNRSGAAYLNMQRPLHEAPDDRLALQAELEARPNRVADVLAACSASTREHNRTYR